MCTSSRLCPPAAQVLTTRAAREREAARRAGPPPRHAVVKVRFPEGVSLRGEFGGGEPASAVHVWVRDALSDPMQTFELVLPSRAALDPFGGGSVREADLLPTCALNFRRAGVFEGPKRQTRTAAVVLGMGSSGWDSGQRWRAAEEI